MNKPVELSKTELEQVSGGFSDYLWGQIFGIGEMIFGQLLGSLAGYLGGGSGGGAASAGGGGRGKKRRNKRRNRR